MKHFGSVRTCIIFFGVAALLLQACGDPQGPELVVKTPKLPPWPTEQGEVVSTLDSVISYFDTYAKASAFLMQDTSATERTDSLRRLIAAYERLLSTLPRHVPLDEWSNARDSFMVRYDNYGGAAPAQWPKDSVVIQAKCLLDTLEAHRPARNHGNWALDSVPGVLFHYGTDLNDRLALGVEFISLFWADAARKELKYQDDKGHFYEIDTATKKLKSAVLGDWRDTHWTNRYLNRVTVREPDLTTFGPVDAGRDANSEAFLGLLVELLSLSNNGGAGKFVITSACDPSVAAEEDSIPHRLMIHVLDGVTGKPRLNNTVDPNKPLLNKALELGSPCPPRCNKVSAP